MQDDFGATRRDVGLKKTGYLFIGILRKLEKYHNFFKKM